MRKEFCLSDEDHKKMLDACKPVPYLVAGGSPPISQRDKILGVWKELGDKLGFDHMTTQPVPGKDDRYFTAEVVQAVDSLPAPEPCGDPRIPTDRCQTCGESETYIAGGKPAGEPCPSPVSSPKEGPRFELVAQPEPGAHRYYLDHWVADPESHFARMAIADMSGLSKVDGEQLYVDESRPLIVGSGGINLPLCTDDGRQYSTPVTPKEAAWLRDRGMALRLAGEDGGYLDTSTELREMTNATWRVAGEKGPQAALEFMLKGLQAMVDRQKGFVHTDPMDPEPPTEYFDVVFATCPDGKECHAEVKFIEVEDEKGASIKLGKWVHREDGYLALRVPRSQVSDEVRDHIHANTPVTGDCTTLEALQGILKSRSDLADLATKLGHDRGEAMGRVGHLESERNAWMETAAQETRNKDYYRGLVVRIGELFGEAAKTCDDGSVFPDVLCAKVPELVEALLDKKTEVEPYPVEITHHDNLRERDEVEVRIFPEGGSLMLGFDVGSNDPRGNVKTIRVKDDPVERERVAVTLRKAARLLEDWPCTRWTTCPWSGRSR